MTQQNSEKNVENKVENKTENNLDLKPYRLFKRFYLLQFMAIVAVIGIALTVAVDYFSNM